MNKILLSVILLTSTIFAEELCEKASQYSVYCYQLRENGKVKSCDEAVEMIENKIKNLKLKKWSKEACQYGCLSESLHEANQMEKFVEDECKRGK